MSLKWHLVLLVVGALLPVVLFAVVVGHRLSIYEQDASERRTLLAARNLANAVESEVSSTIRTLEALAESEHLDQGDLKLFDSEIRRAVQTQPTWLSTILLSPDGHQLVNTGYPFGRPLSLVNEPESLGRVVETHRPAVGNLALRRLEGNSAFPIRVPVMRDGQLRYVLSAVITPKVLVDVIEEQVPIDGEWTRTVVDGRGIVVARTRNPDRFVGQQGTPSFLHRTRESTEGIYRDISLDGEYVYVAFSRMSGSQWTAAVTVPVEVIEGPGRQAMELVVGIGLALLLVSGGGAIVLSRPISRSIAAAAVAAEALTKGEQPQITPSSIREVDLLGAALADSADLLSLRERERDEHLARAEAARTEAEAANRLKDEFLITVSHELRTPLNAILGWAALLRAGTLSKEKAQSAIATIERNAKAQARLVDDLFDTSRIITGKLRLEPQPVNLTTLVVSAIDSVHHAAEAKGIDLKLHVADTVAIWGDQNRLQQVVWNLLSNAVKFTPHGGQVEVSLRAVDSHVELAVRDTGMGIQTDFLPHVFDRFRQSDGSTTRQFGGMGLGLAIVRHLVELHGGTVQADSLGEEQGATFTVRLPLMNQNNRAVKDEENASLLLSAMPLANVRVLLVDDDVDTRDFMAFLLEQVGAVVTVAASAIAALDLFLQVPPDVLVSDIGMPDMDGYMMIQRIRAMPAGQGNQVPAIALTAYAGEINQQQAIVAGFQRHIAKPIEPQELVRAIAALVRQREGVS